MDEKAIATIRQELELRETADLVEIWELNDPNEWTAEAFEAIRQILLTRLEQLPHQDDQGEADLHMDRIQPLLDAGDLEQALAEADAAIQAAPHFGEPHMVRGMVLEEMGRTEEAIQAYQEALRLDDGLWEARKGLNALTKNNPGALPDSSKTINYWQTIRTAWGLLWKEKMVWIIPGAYLIFQVCITLINRILFQNPEGRLALICLLQPVFLFLYAVSLAIDAFIYLTFYHLNLHKQYQIRALINLAIKSILRYLGLIILLSLFAIPIGILILLAIYLYSYYPSISIFLGAIILAIMLVLSTTWILPIHMIISSTPFGENIKEGIQYILKNFWTILKVAILEFLFIAVITAPTTFQAFHLIQAMLRSDMTSAQTFIQSQNNWIYQIPIFPVSLFNQVFIPGILVAFYCKITGLKDHEEIGTALPMKTARFNSPENFLSKVQPFLESREAANSLILGIALRLADHPDWTEQPPYMGAVISDSGSVLLAGLITPPHNLLLAGVESVPPEALAFLAENLRSGGWTLPAVHAANPLAEQFAQVWAKQTGKGTRLQMRQLIYQLDQVIPPSRPAAGELRQATLSDLDLSFEWRAAFIQESLHTQPLPGLRDELRHQIEAGLVYLWLDGEPVSTAVTTRPTPHGMSISGVYTPPALRGRGYASACVAALSQQILDSGKRFCTLFTDADYPASNAIYQAIGYRPIGEFSVFEFEQ
jgi:uncharacterized protein